MKIRKDSDVRKRGAGSIIKTHPLIPSSPHQHSSNIAIRVNHVSKKYCKSLKRSMLYGVKDIGRNILGMSSHSENLRKNEFWALDDVSFEVKKGETLGIIGPNGSGKTTLLKLLNGIFWPDKGKITIKGKVGALIEVGAGFHPLLTGRENVYINAAILGMTKKEVDEKFDSIVEFADIGDFIDAPVKFYSSGMFVRLGFAVAVHCKPDVLLVDEVLAVGDMNFQVKCLQRMLKLKNNNKTIVFISHNLDAISGLCDKTTLLTNGKIIFIGDTQNAIAHYKEYTFNTESTDKDKLDHRRRRGTGDARIERVQILNKEDVENKMFKLGELMKVRVSFYAKKLICSPVFTIDIFRIDGLHSSCIDTRITEFKTQKIKGRRVVELEYLRLNLIPNSYYLTVAVYESGALVPYDLIEKARYFSVIADQHFNGNFYLEHKWRYMKDG